METPEHMAAALSDMLSGALNQDVSAEDLSTRLTQRELLVLYERHINGESWVSMANRFKIDSGAIQRIAQRANQKLVQMRKLKQRMESVVDTLLETGDSEWSEAWLPSPEILAYFEKVIWALKPQAVWGMPRTGQVYKVDKDAKTFTLIQGDPHDPDHWHDKTRKTLAVLGWKVNEKLKKSAGSLNLQAELGNLVNHPKSGVLFLSTGLGYAVDEIDKLMILMQGKPDAAHAQVKAFMQPHGWTVLDGPDDNPNEMSFAESIRSELYEEAASPFSKGAVTLQYRPFQMDGAWQWAWVLLPDDRSKALGHGQGINRAVAAVNARKEARKLGVTIAKIDVLKPYEKP